MSATIATLLKEFHQLPAIVQIATGVAAISGPFAYCWYMKKQPRKSPIKEDWEKDVVYIYQFPPAAVVPNLSPYALKLETWLRMANITFENVPCSVSLRSTEGTLPFVEFNGKEYVDSTFIIRDLSRIFNINENLSPEQEGAGRAFQMMMDKIHSAWRKIANSLSKINELKMPRFVTSVEQGSVELHTFCDASAKACAAAVYLRVVDDGNVTCALMMSKTRLAPTKQSQTIPRLELIAAVIRSRLMSFVREHLGLNNSKLYLWTDSQCTLCWIKNQRVLAPFVRNRVNEIRKESGVEFLFVPTAENPADLPSRGCDSDALQHSTTWFSGPKWLQDNSSTWPKMDDIGVNTGEEVCVATEAISSSEGVIDETRFSSFRRLNRSTAFVLRFVHNCRTRRDDSLTGVLTCDELAAAKIYWCRDVQRKHFPELTTCQESVWPKGVGRQLNVFRDSGDILRTGGRIDSAKIDYDQKHPILLPKTSHFTDLVVKDAHSRLLHGGVAQTLAETRKRFWIINGRSVVKRVRCACQHCRKLEGGPFRIPPAPPLPEARVREAPPFSFVGVDYLGPLFIKSSDGSNVKVWICLYTCMVVRAVFLDVVEALSAEQFLLSVRRSMSFYGQPTEIVSDNATQFHKVQKFVEPEWLLVTQCDEVQTFAANAGIRWKFIVEFAPWMGGFYERLVGEVKRSLRKSLSSAVVSLCELRTVVSEIAAVVNSRPLVYVEDDPNSTSLTPAHFLANHTVLQLPESTVVQDADYSQHCQLDSLITRWRRLQSILQKFWDSWRNQYLTSLREHHGAHKQRNCSEVEAAVGSVVQIKCNLPRLQWRLGRIVKLHISKDNCIRSASIRMANGRILHRPLKLLYPLEISSSNEPDDIVVSGDGGALGKDDPDVRRPQRHAALEASRKIASQMK